MDKEIYTKALKWYAERKDKDMLKLAKYSKKLNIEKRSSGNYASDFIMNSNKLNALIKKRANGRMMYHYIFIKCFSLNMY